MVCIISLDVFALQVANKLYPLSSIAQQIEDFALKMLLSVINVDSSERTDANGSTTEALKVMLPSIQDVKFHSEPTQLSILAWFGIALASPTIIYFLIYHLKSLWQTYLKNDNTTI